MLNTLLTILSFIVVAVGLIWAARYVITFDDKFIVICREWIQLASSCRGDWRIHGTQRELFDLGVSAMGKFSSFQELNAQCYVSAEIRVNDMWGVIFFPYVPHSPSSVYTAVYAAFRMPECGMPLFQLKWNVSDPGLPLQSAVSKIRSDWAHELLPSGEIYGDDETAIRRICSLDFGLAVKSETRLAALESVDNWILFIGECPGSADSFTEVYDAASHLLDAIRRSFTQA